MGIAAPLFSRRSPVSPCTFFKTLENLLKNSAARKAASWDVTPLSLTFTKTLFLLQLQ